MKNTISHNVLASGFSGQTGNAAAHTKEIYRCRANLTFRKDVVVTGADGNPVLNMVWKDKTKGKLRVFGDRLVFKNFFCKPFVIPYNCIKQACLFSTTILGFRCRLLWIVYTEGSIGIAFSNNRFWDEPLPFSVVRESARLSKADIFKGIASHLAAESLSVVAGAAFHNPNLGNFCGDVVSDVSEDVLDEMASPSDKPSVSKPKPAASRAPAMANPQARKRVPIQWFYRENDQQLGPISAKQLKQLAELSAIQRDTAVRRSIDTRWIQARKVQGLFANTSPVASPSKTSRNKTSRSKTSRSKSGTETTNPPLYREMLDDMNVRSPKHLAENKSRLSRSERGEERYFRGAKGDSNKPDDAYQTNAIKPAPHGQARQATIQPRQTHQIPQASKSLEWGVAGILKVLLVFVFIVVFAFMGGLVDIWFQDGNTIESLMESINNGLKSVL